MEKIYSVNGVDKNLDVFENKIVLTEKKVRGVVFWAIVIGLTCSTIVGGLIFYLMWNINNGNEKSIYIKNIKSIELKKPTSMLNGVVQFNLDDSSNFGSNWGSENSVTFKGIDNYNKCAEIRDYIERKAC